MNNDEAIRKGLEKLREYVQLLKTLHKTPKEKFFHDPFVKGNVKRYLQLAIQAILDIGNHIISNLKVKAPEEYREIFIYFAAFKISLTFLIKTLNLQSRDSGVICFSRSYS